jgi:tetratricopeptide (TPR) repeat protein
MGGKVVMADGSTVPPKVAVIMSCTGGSGVVVYATANGAFAFPNQNSASPDCQVFAARKGYKSTVNVLNNKIVAGSSDAGVLILTAVKTTEGVTTSATFETAPKEAVKLYEAGVAADKKGKPADAVKAFEKATSIYPQFADAWYRLGRAQLAAAATDAAIVSLKKSIEIDPLLVGPQVQLGILAGQKEQWEPSAKYLDQALDLDPVDYPMAWYPDAVANLRLGRFDRAEKAAREALRVDPKHQNPRIEYVLAMILAETGDTKAAAATLKDYLAHTPGVQDVDRVRSMIADLEKGSR